MSLDIQNEKKVVRKGDIFKSKNYGWVMFKGFDYHPFNGEKTAKLYSEEYRDTFYPFPEGIEQIDNVEFVDL